MAKSPGGAMLLVVLCSWVLFPSVAPAQQTPSGIAGAVRDAAGMPLSGVTVEATSPALIEKVRTVVTDGAGQYKILDVPPGIYAVTFTLPGFTTFRREGIELPAGFTATVNPSMQPGASEETITETSTSPLIDTQNTRQLQSASSATLEAAPTAAKATYTLAALTPGLTGTADVGGSSGVSSNVGGTFHGKSGGNNKTMLDGMRFQNMQGVGNSFYIVNSAAVQEMVIETGGATAESIAAGYATNLIPKQGSNTFAFMISGLYTNEDLQSSNLNDALRARGLTTEQKVVKLFDVNGTAGGPIKVDRLWFFTAHRVWGNRNQVPGVFWNATQGTPFYTPDLTRPWVRRQTNNSHPVRLTWQATPRNKFNFFSDLQQQTMHGSAAQFIAPEAVSSSWHFWPTGLFQMSWSAPATSRLLLEAGASASINHWPGLRPPGVEPSHISINELSTGFVYNNRATLGVGNSGNHARRHTGDRYSQRFSVSYITGSHAYKVGFQMDQGLRDMETIIDGDVQYQFLRGVPVSLRQFATPYLAKDRMKADLGIFLQDQWTVRRLTLNYGMRINYFNAYVPEQHLPPATWVGARDFAAVRDVPEWLDLDPRFGASYDLFGTGRTALKVSLGRYVVPAGLDITGNVNPMVTSVNQVDRAWSDANGNFVPDCDLRNFGANGECGPIDNIGFGQLDTTSTQYAEEVLRGFSRRGYNWDFAVEAQHELLTGVSLAGGYYRNWDGNFRVTDNLAVTSADYDPYCVSAPADPRLPGGGGNEVCGLYDITPGRFGQVRNLVTFASDYGKQKRVNDFVGLSVNTRFASGMRLGGGFDTGRTVEDRCFVVDSPQDLLYCRVVTPFSANTQVKINGSYPLPGDFAVSGVLQSVAGPVILANYPAPTSLIAPSLGRNLAGGRRTATVPLIEPQTQFEKRRVQLDLRLTKSFNIGPRARAQAKFDVYNVLNANSILSRNDTFGSQWGRPASILDGRLIQFAGQLNF